jgi:uncharacterized NAD-dependent epimerase/dehydratase family protein
MAAGQEPQAVLEHKERPFTIGVVGTSMNSGKTTTVASIVRGLTGGGLSFRMTSTPRLQMAC